MLVLCKQIYPEYSKACDSHVIFTKEDAEFFLSLNTLSSASEILHIKIGECPKSVIRGDLSADLNPLEIL